MGKDIIRALGRDKEIIKDHMKIIPYNPQHGKMCKRLCDAHFMADLEECCLSKWNMGSGNVKYFITKKCKHYKKLRLLNKLENI